MPILAGVVTLVTLLVGAVYLSQAPEPATLQLVTRPPDVVVTVDGARVAADRSPFVLTDLEPDVKHEIIVGKLGHREWATSIVLRPGQTLALPEVTLAPLARSVTGATVNAPTASAATASPPAAAPTPPPPSAGSPAQVHAVAPPSHAAPARLEGSHVAPPTGAAATSRDGTGFLRINTRPWSEIYVDGDHVGNTPQMNLQVPAGGHVVRLSNPQFGVSKTIRIEVAPGEVVSRSLTLE